MARVTDAQLAKGYEQAKAVLCADAEFENAVRDELDSNFAAHAEKAYLRQIRKRIK